MSSLQGIGYRSTRSLRRQRHLILLPSAVTHFPRAVSARLDVVDRGLCSQFIPIGSTPPVTPVRNLALSNVPNW
ncbi:hypothetical protein PISMIDRAFT_671830 [Pisolithus microcarpus 441]|uniref:Uncharacterized protein n=1 Tax=Pisolithus microcarpus 441 TaxID=765257 RepID=A0A0D0A5Y5_9AGAM|nr:hypothetical protein BKA83DRAFT_671830 [Pisolithus microcarpus]KIK29862.1 hypothetical protein PISMIDRAFT_671830 [Pisolithus microcarpus 441]